MESYTSFARVYDVFQDNIPYEEWTDYLEKLLRKYGVEDGLVLDLGCGTGNITQLLARKGYDMIGIDHSEEMLEIAMEKKEDSGFDILYLLQDMREFELFGTVGGIISICDSMNYILSKNDLLKVFRLVNNYLDPHGIFIFDLNTIYKFEHVMGDMVIAENREDSSFIWENYYYSEERINEYNITLFIKENDNLYKKYEEVHHQHGYTVEEIKELILESGMEYVAAYDAFTKNNPKEDSERIYIIAREQGKKNS